MDIPSILTYALTLTVTFKYLLVFIGTVVEGPVLMVAAGFLVHQGVFDAFPLYVTIIAGDLTGDIGWYFIGYYLLEPFMKKHGRFMGVTPNKFERIKGLFLRHHEWILFVSKVTVGLGLSLGTLMVAGATGVSFKKYISINLLGEIVLAAALLSVGYFFAEMYKYVDKSLQAGFIIGSGVVVVGVLYGFTSYMKKRAETL